MDPTFGLIVLLLALLVVFLYGAHLMNPGWRQRARDAFLRRFVRRLSR